MAFPYTVQAANEVLRAAEELADAVRLGGVTMAGQHRIHAAQDRVVRKVCLYRIAQSVEHVNGPDIDALATAFQTAEPEVYEVVDGNGDHVRTIVAS